MGNTFICTGLDYSLWNFKKGFILCSSRFLRPHFHMKYTLWSTIFRNLNRIIFRPSFFYFLASRGIFIGVYFRNWPNFLSLSSADKLDETNKIWSRKVNSRSRFNSPNVTCLHPWSIDWFRVIYEGLKVETMRLSTLQYQYIQRFNEKYYWIKKNRILACSQLSN